VENLLEISRGKVFSSLPKTQKGCEMIAEHIKVPYLAFASCSNKVFTTNSDPADCSKYSSGPVQSLQTHRDGSIGRIAAKMRRTKFRNPPPTRTRERTKFPVSFLFFLAHQTRYAYLFRICLSNKQK